MTKRHYKFAVAEDLIMEHLRRVGPATIQELMHEIGKGRDATRKAIDRLHADGRVYIKDWPYVGIQRARLWAFRNMGQKDMPKPRPRTMSEHNAEWRKRHAAILKARRSVNAAKGNPFAMLIK